MTTKKSTRILTDKYTDLFNLKRVTKNQLVDFMKNGYEKISDIPVERVGDKEYQKLQILSHKEKIVNVEEIKKFLDGLEFPLYFLDYETFSESVPSFDGQRPYQQVPFQYSLHILDSEGNLTRKGYLHLSKDNPAKKIIVS